MNNNNIEFVRIIIGLREEYVRNQKRLETLKSLVKIDPERYKNFYFYLTGKQEELRLNLQLVENETFKSRLKRAFIPKNANPVVSLNKDGEVSFGDTNAIIVTDQVTFNEVLRELLNDPYLNSNFASLSVVGDSVFRIGIDSIRLENVSHEPTGARYIGPEDTIQCVYYYPPYTPMIKRYAEELLYTPIPRENISSLKQQIIDSNPNAQKEIVMDDDITFDITRERSARLNLGIEESGESIRLHKKN